MDQHHPSFPNPNNNRFPPFFPPSNPHHHHLPPPRLPPPAAPPPPLLPHQSPISRPRPPPPPPNSFHHLHDQNPHQFVNPPHRGRLHPVDDHRSDPHPINQRNHGHNLRHGPPDFPQSPRFSDRFIYEDDRRNRPRLPLRGLDDDPYRLPIGGPAVWNPRPRIPVDAPPPPVARRIPRVGFDRDPPLHRPINVELISPSFQQVDRFRDEHDGGSRIREELNMDRWFRVDELSRERRVDLLNNDNFHRDRLQRDLDRGIHQKEFSLNSTNVEHFSRLVPEEELIRKSRGDIADENLRRGHLPRGVPHSMVELRNRAIDGGSGYLEFFEKGKNDFFESERYGDRNRSQDAQDFSLTPRKKLKKKNAFFRMQPGKPSIRNAYEHSPSLSKDRETLPIPDHRFNKERERSPIVSFKSNLLIVASSSSGAVADEPSAFTDGKNKNEVMGNTGDSNLQSNVVGKVPLNPCSDNPCENDSCTMIEEDTQLEKKTKLSTNLKKEKPSGGSGLPVRNSEAPSCSTECLPEDIKPFKSPKSKVLDKRYTVVGSGKGSSPSFRKKRKITIPHSSVSSSVVLKKDSDSVSVDNLVINSSSDSGIDKGIEHSGKDLPSYAKVTGSIVNASQTESTIIKSPKAADEKMADDSVSAGTPVPKVKRRKMSKPRPCSSRQLSGKPDEIPATVIGSERDDHATSNSNGMTDKFQKGSSSDMGINDSSDMCLDLVPKALQRGDVEGSSEAAPSLEGCTNVLSAPDSMDSPERQPNFRSSGGPNSSSSPDCVSVVKNKKINLVKEPCENQTSLSCDDGVFDESVKAKFSDKDNKNAKISTVGEFDFSEIPDVSFHKAAICGAADNADVSAVNDISKLSWLGRLSKSIEFGVSREFPEASETLEGDLSLSSDKVSVSKNDRKGKGSELHQYTGKINGDAMALGCSIDSGLVQDKVAVSGSTIPDVHLELPIRNDVSMNGSRATRSSQGAVVSVGEFVNTYPTEVVTSASNKKNIVLAPQLGSAPGAPTEVCETPVDSDTLPCDAKLPSHPIESLPISAEEVGMPVSDCASQSVLAPVLKGLDFSYCNNASSQISASLKSVEGTCGKGSPNFVFPGTDSSLAVNVSVVPDEKQTSDLSESASLPGVDGTLLTTEAGDGCVGVGVESGNERSTCNQNAAGDCSSQNKCTDKNVDHSEPPIVNADREPLVRDMEYDINIPVNDDLPAGSECLPLFIQSTIYDGIMNSSPMTNNLARMDSPETLSATTSSEMFDVPNLNRFHDGKVYSADKKSNGKSMIEAGSLSCFASSSTLENRVHLKKASAIDGIANSSGKIMTFLPSQNAAEVLRSSNNEKMEQTGIKSELNLASAKAHSSHSSFTASSSGRRPTTVIKSRTWHRTDNPPSNQPVQNSSVRFVPRQKPTFNQTARAQRNSYVRKGNSLLRSPATAVSQGPSASASSNLVPQLNPSASDDAKNSLCEMPQKLSSPCNTDLSIGNLASSGDCRSSPVVDSTTTMESGPQRSPEDMTKSLGNSEFETGKNLEDQGAVYHCNQVASNTRRMVYIKRKSNQLVAAPNPTDSSASTKDVSTSMSDIYYKRKKNQLVRAASETNPQTTTDPDDSSNSEGQRIFKPYVSSSATKKDPNRVSQKIPKSRKLSLVWTLHNTLSPKKGSLRCQQVLPHLLPWKRATYRRSFFRTSANFAENSPLRMISRKLLSSRKRHIIYKRSGFSLRRSKVVSLAGFSLKWSKSLERRSKKVDKEATLAVAALEKDKGEKNAPSDVISGIESKNVSLRGRIYRIGSCRYKMDPSRRTLQRFPDEEPSSSNTIHQEKEARKPSIPRRLLIGNDEYVRIGNGNQLIRNPKRRTRILASEKVRWSLHTARTRLAKKKKYCQFFTRFGKCTKDEGKCPYIHDPSKIAVCTKFLNGLCSDPECKLTHKVIPERMPDCSFFLQGLCSNENCPYRHVNVNPKAAVCGSFLKGYCADGNECQKKHSYICPTFEAKGECPEGSKCKLYHPKKGKDKNRKNTKYRKNTWGRYFGSAPATGNSEPETEGIGKRFVPKDDNIILEDGSLADYISLDAIEEEDGEQEDEPSEQMITSDVEQFNLVFDDSEELIKPIRLLGKKSFQVMSQLTEGCGLNDEPLCQNGTVLT